MFTLLFATLGCDPEDLEVEGRDASIDAPAELAGVEEDAEPLPAVLAGKVALAPDVEVSFFELASGGTAMILVGPATSPLTAELEAVNLVMRDAIDADEATARMIDLVEERGLGDMPLSAAPGSSVQSAAGPGGSAPDQIAAPPRVTKVTCDGVLAVGSTAANQGNCSLFAKDNGDYSYFEGDDLIAYAGQVTAVQGSVFWDVRLQSWGVSGWYWGLQSYALAQGQQAYYSHSDVGNDFNMTTRVESTSNNGTHHHDFARCHDWYARVNALASYPDSGCGIKTAAGTILYSHGNDYVGPESTNIPTGMAWN